MNEDETFMRLALEQAILALKNKWIPIGAVFVKDGQIVTHGRKTGIRHTLFDHAEHNGCYQILWDRGGARNLEGFTVYSTLEPCLMCLSMLMAARVSRIVYGSPDPYGGGVMILKDPSLLPVRFKDRVPLIEGGVLLEESQRLLRQFFKNTVHTNSEFWSNEDNPLVRLVTSVY